MTIKRIIAIVIIYALAFSGWMILGTATAVRSVGSMSNLSRDVSAMWGKDIVQHAPRFEVAIPGSERTRKLLADKNTIAVDLHSKPSKRGLLWFPTFDVGFAGAYTLTNTDSVAQKVQFHFNFPVQNATYDAFAFTVDGVSRGGNITPKDGIHELVELKPGQSATFAVNYKTRGQGQWRYLPGGKLGRVRGLDLTVNTNFADYDYVPQALSASTKTVNEQSATLLWQASDLITQAPIGIIIPEKLNPGPVASRVIFFAPVCLLFFFVLVAAITVIKKIDIHPMHYLFVASGFFAFHLLLAYLVDHMPLSYAFVLCSLITIFLVSGYMKAALKGHFPLPIAIGGQIFFLVLFSYSFFFKGISGLTIAIGSVATLAVLMKVTAHVDWNQIFKRSEKAEDTDGPIITDVELVPDPA